MKTATQNQIKPWSYIEEADLAAIAKRLFKCDQHEQHDEYREQCGACVLQGYLSDSAKADGFTPEEGPNYAGWARCYVQARRPIPFHWFGAFCDQLTSDNTSYADALKRDIVTFGLTFKAIDTF